MTRAQDVMERSSFDTSFEAVRPRLLRICAGLVGRTDADDIVQETYLRALRGLSGLRDPGAFESWVTRIAVRACYGHHRFERRQHVPRSPHGNTSAQTDAGLTELIERLPRRQRTVLVLHHGYGYRLDEIASILGLTHTNVRTVIARARRKLLEQWMEGEE